MQHIQGNTRSQLLLLPERVDDYVGPDNPVRFTDAFVDGMNLQDAGFFKGTAKIYWSPGLWSRIIGESRALDMLMTGRPVDAKEAYHFGLADRLVAKGDALKAATELAQQLAEFPQTALLSDRKSAMTQWDYPELEAINREIEGSQAAFQDSFQSGAGSFVNGTGRHEEF